MSEIQLTDDNFKEQVLNSDLPVLVDFWAPWCGPCLMLGPVIAQLAEEYQGKLKVGKLNTDESKQIATQYGIMSIPTIMLFKAGELKEKWIGVQPKVKLAQAIAKYI